MTTTPHPEDMPASGQFRKKPVVIDTLEQGHRVCPGDWIITGVKGDRYPCKPDIFAATYEPADAPLAEQRTRAMREDAYWRGWCEAADWANRDDLRADRDSQAYADAMNRRLALSTPIASKEEEPFPGDLCLRCYGSGKEPTRAPLVDKSANPQGSLVDKSTEMQGQSAHGKGEAEDAARWRRLVNASEMAFPVATIADDPENAYTMLYGRQRLERYIDSLDEISDQYALPPAPAQSGGQGNV